MAKEGSRYIESVLKALSIIECFSYDRPRWSLKELSEITRIPASGVLRLCGTLESRRFIRRDPNGEFQLGPMFLTFGKVYEDTNSLVSLARPILRKLSNATSESASLFVRQGTKRLCIACENGPGPVNYNYYEGQLLKLNTGAGGKILVAYAEPGYRNHALAQLHGSSTISIKFKKLINELDEVKRKGYAVTLGEVFPEAAALAVPVRNHTNHMVATLTIAGPLQRFTPQHRDEILTHLQQAGIQLSILLGNKIELNPD